MMPTMQEIDEWYEKLRTKSMMLVDCKMLADLCAAARRGVEADAHVKYADEQYGNCMNDLQNTKRRAERLEAELAALKAAQPQEYPSSADDEATRWRHGEAALVEALAGFEGKAAQPESDPMMEVPCDEANNYSKILSLLGMDEEGDPVEAVRALLSETAQPERVSVPVSDERIMEIAKSVGMQGMLTDVVTTTDELKAFARALLAAAPASDERVSVPIPEELFDGNAVYASLAASAIFRTSEQNVSDTLDAVVRLIRKRLAAAQEGK